MRTFIETLFLCITLAVVTLRLTAAISNSSFSHGVQDGSIIPIELNHALIEDSQFPSDEYSRIIGLDSRLRSAFLVRAFGDSGFAKSCDSETEQEELQRHFDLIIDLLEDNTRLSLQVALERLETASKESWSIEDRELKYLQLMKERDKNIARLKAYRDRGMFPLNEGHADHGVPIFVDDHDTACAVGHLMRCSGWESAVEEIALTNLFVYVPDVKEGPVVDWVLRSGLTQEEAALIQPIYSPPISNTPMSTLSGTGAGFDMNALWFDGSTQHVVSNGLRFENFLWSEWEPSGDGYVGWLDISTPGSPTTDPNPEDFGTRTDHEFVCTRDCSHFPAASYGPN